MNRQRFLTWAVVGMLMCVLSPAVDAGWWDSLSDAKPVKLETVLKDPHGWKGKEITFICVFHKVSTMFNPYYTRFVPDEYVNFSAWPLSKRLWVKDEFLDSHKFLFLEKDHDQYEDLLELEKFTRVQLTGFVQSAFKESPWIEIRHIKVLSGGITKDALKHIILGDRAAKRKEWRKAMAFYDRAVRMSLPKEVMASISKKRASTLHRMGRDDAARVALKPALEYNPNDAEVTALLEEMNKLSPAPRTKPVKLESSEEVVAEPVDPKKYSEEPKAMPVPEKQPAVEEPAKLQPADEPVVAPEKPTVPERPVVIEPKPEPDVPEGSEDEPNKKDAPKKRMSGPM